MNKDFTDPNNRICPLCCSEMLQFRWTKMFYVGGNCHKTYEYICLVCDNIQAFTECEGNIDNEE